MTNAYYIEYTNDFSNAYNLWHAPAGAEVPEGLERITRREAERKCREERERRTYDSTFGGYADAYIFPVSCYGKNPEIIDTVRGYLVPETAVRTWEA